MLSIISVVINVKITLTHAHTILCCNKCILNNTYTQYCVVINVY